MLQQEILINWSPQQTRVAVVENGEIQELLLERSADVGLTGNIFLGKVVRVLAGMQSAFVDIGLGKDAFLHVADLHTPHQERKTAFPEDKHENTPLIPIEKRIFEGQTLMVQVIKEPIASKAARLSSQISLAGRLLVYMPQDRHIGASQKIPLAQRSALIERLTALMLELPVALQAGLIARTSAQEVDDDALRADLQELAHLWQSIKNASVQLPAKSCLYQQPRLLQRVLRDIAGVSTQRIQIDSREQYAVLQQYCTKYAPQFKEKLLHYQGDAPIFDLYGMETDLQAALQRRVELKSGAYLVIDQTEALTSIDVNTGKFVGKRDFADTILQTNLQAAKAIARQLRLRNFGGIIVIDFIDMIDPKHQTQVLQALRGYLAQDRAKTMVHDFSPLGLVEMTRKRSTESLQQLLCQPCPQCEGRAYTKTAITVAHEILREILRQARQFNPREIKVIANPQVAEIFLAEQSPYLNSLSSFIAKPIVLQSDASLTQEQYDIVLQ